MGGVYLKSMEEVIAEYKKAYPHVNLTIYQQELLEFEITDLEAWKQTIRFWAGNDYRGQSIFKMIEYYKGVINGTHRQLGQKRTDADVIRESQDFYNNFS